MGKSLPAHPITALSMPELAIRQYPFSTTICNNRSATVCEGV